MYTSARTPTTSARLQIWLLLIGTSLLMPLEALYSNNQNTYLLHAVKNTVYPGLANDWLANTTDVFNVFSAIVSGLIDAAGPASLVVFGYLATTVCFISAFFMVTLGQRASSGSYVMFCILQAAFWGHLVNGWAANGLAGQFIISPHLLPASLGCLLFAGLLAYLRHYRYLSTLLIASAAWLHASYIMAGSILLLACLLVNLKQKAKVGEIVCLGLTFSALLFPLIVSLSTELMAQPATTRTLATEILFHQRIPHHADPSIWFNAEEAARIVATLWAAYLARRQMLGQVLLVTAILSLAISIASWAIDSKTLLLMFPWRIFALLTPLSFSILCWHLSTKVTLSRSLCIGVIAASLLAGTYNMAAALEEPVRPANDIHKHITHNSSERSITLIHPDNKSFRLETGRAAFIDWKSHPYHAGELVEWHLRVKLAQQYFDNPDQCGLLAKINSIEPINLVLYAKPTQNPCYKQLTPSPDFPTRLFQYRPQAQ